MRGDLQAIDQLTIGVHTAAGGGNVELAKLDGRDYAILCPCPGGYAVRLLSLNYPEPGWQTIFPDRDAAIEGIRLWVSGFDIVPLDADGRPEIVDS